MIRLNKSYPSFHLFFLLSFVNTLSLIRIVLRMKNHSLNRSRELRWLFIKKKRNFFLFADERRRKWLCLISSGWYQTFQQSAKACVQLNDKALYINFFQTKLVLSKRNPDKKKTSQGNSLEIFSFVKYWQIFVVFVIILGFQARVNVWERDREKANDAYKQYTHQYLSRLHERFLSFQLSLLLRVIIIVIIRTKYNILFLCILNNRHVFLHCLLSFDTHTRRARCEWTCIYAEIYLLSYLKDANLLKWQ